MKPDGKFNVPWELRGYSDVDYAVDNDTQNSVIVYIVLINALFIYWYSLIHKTVTLTIAEADYSEIMEVDFYFLLWLFSNTPFILILIVLELYYYRRKYWYSNKRTK